MTPWFIATEPFSPHSGETWAKYVAWSGLPQLQEVVSLDPILCPSVLQDIQAGDWPYIVNEDFMLHYFTDLDFLLRRVSGVRERNLLCVYRNPPAQPDAPAGFAFLGYDLLDVMSSASALTNCGGFPDVFENRELSAQGLLTLHARACEVQAQLRANHPGEPHADCHVWAIFRAA